MEEKELKALLDGVAEKHKAAVKSEIENAVNAAGLVTTKNLEEKFTAMGLTDKSIKELTEAVEKQGEELRKIFENPKGVNKSFDEMLNDKAKEIKSLATDGGPRTIKIDMIGAGVNKTQVERSAVSGNTMAMRLAGIGELPYLGMVMAPLFRRGSIGAGMNGTIRYYDQAAITRGADMKAEAAAYAESVISWIERTAIAEKITDSIPVTKESFNDIDFIKGELDRLLNLNLALKEDQQLYAGTGNTPQIKGINVYATAKDAVVLAAPYAQTVNGANLYDLIAVLRVILMTSKQSKYAMSHVLMNPVDILKYKLKKAADGHYLLPPFITADGRFVDGVQIVESNQVTQNTLTAGDFRYGTIYEAQGLEVEMGWINDQFVKDAMTIKASKRELLLVRNVDADAFLKITDIDAAVAGLED